MNFELNLKFAGYFFVIGRYGAPRSVSRQVKTITRNLFVFNGIISFFFLIAKNRIFGVTAWTFIRSGGTVFAPAILFNHSFQGSIQHI